MSDTRDSEATRRRLGRAVLFILQQDPVITDAIVRADVETLLLAGRAMDFACRLQGYGTSATPEIAREYARLAGFSERQMRSQVLPVLRNADVLSCAEAADGTITHIDELVGITGTVIEQTFRILDILGPSNRELAVLHSVEIAAWAPLTESQHLEQVTRRGLRDEDGQAGLRLALAMGINRRVRSTRLNEYVIFNPHVWGTRQVDIATYLKNLPSAERDVLFAIFEQATSRPGIALDQMTAGSSILTGARKVGLVQAATVKSTRGARSRTYVFSPLIQATDDAASTTEALHLRKLFVAHILFGHEQATPGLGRIKDPTVLVNALLRRGQVGPATNISTDYYLLESRGVVRVEPEDNGRAVLRLIKREIVEAGLEWLQAGLGGIAGPGSGAVNLDRSPGSFVRPEVDRAQLPDDGATTEIMVSAVLALREETQRVARADSPFIGRS